MYPYFKLFGREFSSYWTVFWIALMLALVWNLIRGKKRGISSKYIIAYSLAVDFMSLVGAKLLFWLENIPTYLQRGSFSNGVSFFGSLFLAPVGVWLICKCLHQEKDWLDILDFVSPSLMLILAALRVGCYVSGCCGGIPVVLAGFRFSVFPTQLTECFFDLMIMIGLLIYEKYWSKKGRLYLFIMLYYGIMRFILEFARDTSKDWLGFSHGQWFAVISVVIGAYILHRLEKKEKKRRVVHSSKKRKRR